MNSNYIRVVAVLSICFTAISNNFSQNTITLSGIVNYYGEPVKKVEVNVINANQSFPTFITGEDGFYRFETDSVEPLLVTMTLDRNDNHRNGVTTLDLVLIQKHLLGIERFTDPRQLVAADANNSASISAIDYVVLRKLILGLISVLPNQKSWRFYQAGAPISEIASFTWDHDIIRNFEAIKIGDVNHTANPGFQTIVKRSDNPPAYFTTPEKSYRPGEVVELNFSLKDLNAIEGFQFTLADDDLEFTSVTSGAIEINESDYALFGNKVTMSWFTAQGNKPDPDATLFTVKAIARKSGNLHSSLSISSDITEAELYSDQDEIFSPMLKVTDQQAEDFTLFPVSPNPWKENCVITFYTPETGMIRLVVSDATGRMVYTSSQFFQAGINAFDLNKNEITTQGMLFYNLQDGRRIVAGKMNH